MQKPLVFLINSSAELTAYTGLAGRYSRQFTADAAGRRAFEELLQTHAARPCILLVDVAEEDFRLEHIPKLRGRQRQIVIQRKLAQHFHDTAFVSSLSHGLRVTQREEEAILAMALTQPQLIEPWLQLIQACGNRLTGIYTVPQLHARLLPPSGTPPAILLLALSGAGLRQTFVVAGKLRLARLTPCHCHNAAEFAALLQSELESLRQYLLVQRLIARDSRLPVRILAHPDWHAQLRQQCGNLPDLDCELLSLSEQSRQLRLRSLEDASSATQQPARVDALFCQLLLQQLPAAQFAPETLRQAQRLWNERHMLKLASLCILLGGLLAVIWLQNRSETVLASDKQLRQALQLAQQSYQELLAKQAISPLPAAAMQQLLQQYAGLVRQSADPIPMLQQLGSTLENFPSVRLERIEWQVQDGSSKAAAAEAWLEAHIYASLPLQLAADGRRQNAVVEAMTQQLAQAGNLQLRLLEAPLDTRSTASLAGGNDGAADQAAVFSFSLRQRL